MEKTWQSRFFGQGRTRSCGPRLCGKKVRSKNLYDEIILGMPVWAGMPASPVNTFIKNYGVADKIDAVFTFSGGGDNDRCLLQLSKSLKNLKNQVALADRNSDKAKDNEEKLEKFVMEIRK